MKTSFAIACPLAAVLAAVSLSACQREPVVVSPTVVSVPTPVPGPAGPAGAPGAPAAPAEKGAAGAPGAPGAPGMDGAKGDPGKTGKTGGDTIIVVPPPANPR